MKNVLRSSLAACLMIVSLAAHAGGNDIGNAGLLMNQLKALNGRSGKLVDSYDKENSGKCRLQVVADTDGMTVSFEDTGMYFTPVAHIYETTQAEDANTLLVSTNSKRPGGDACGDFGGAVRYKKQVAIKGNVVAIRETFRCSFEGFKKYDLMTVCQF